MAIRGERFEPLGIGVGTLIEGRYDVTRRLGSGGMSVVYEVNDRALNNERCALKLFSPTLSNNPILLARFRNEVSITRKLNHPNIVRTFEFGQVNRGQYYYMTMEYLDGKTLQHLIYEGRENNCFPFLSTVRIIHEVAKGIAHAHSVGVIHRDLKPANILISSAGDIKVADFGLAQTEESDLQLTKAGECVGTPAYMSPEQIQEQPHDHRIDIYALGILAYELNVGEVPFQKEGWFDLAKQIINDPLPDFASKKIKIPSWFQEFVKKATQKKPEDRYSSADEVVALFDEHLQDIREPGSFLDMGRHTTKLELHLTRGKRNILSFTLQNSPYLLLASAIIVGLFAIFTAGDKAVEKVSQDLAKPKSTLDDFVSTVKKMHELVVTTVEQKPLIDAKYRKAKKKKVPAEQLEVSTAAPVVKPESIVPTPVVTAEAKKK